METQLSPNESVTVDYYITDPTDTNTYYVQAIVYDARTHAVIETLNLTDNGNRWFSKAWQVPSGGVYWEGRHIIIITTVYTDSGYTTKASYYEDMKKYLVQQRWNPTAFGAGGGGSIDEEKLSELVAKTMDLKLGGMPQPERFPMEEMRKMMDAIPKPERVDITPVLSALQEVNRSIQNIPKPERTDLSSVQNGLARVVSAIQTLESTQRQESVVGAVREIKDAIAGMDNAMNTMNARYMKTSTSFQNIIDKMSELFGGEQKKNKRDKYLSDLYAQSQT